MDAHVTHGEVSRTGEDAPTQQEARSVKVGG